MDKSERILYLRRAVSWLGLLYLYGAEFRMSFKGSFFCVASEVH
jgi:hypothetical protein